MVMALSRAGTAGSIMSGNRDGADDEWRREGWALTLRFVWIEADSL
jgi:hypothetical protein